MKKFILLLLITATAISCSEDKQIIEREDLIGVLLLSAGSISEPTSFSNVEPLVVDCPKCKVEYKSCTDAAEKIFTTAVQNAADSLKSKTLKIDYNAVCEEARIIKNKAIAKCTAAFNKCCLAETKAEMEKEKKDNSNFIL